nr:MAG TPA: hypothetical protein [Caudoviricetes sp.]
MACAKRNVTIALTFALTLLTKINAVLSFQMYKNMALCAGKRVERGGDNPRQGVFHGVKTLRETLVFTDV